jgi:hypothetical protein
MWLGCGFVSDTVEPADLCFLVYLKRSFQLHSLSGVEWEVCNEWTGKHVKERAVQVSACQNWRTVQQSLKYEVVKLISMKQDTKPSACIDYLYVRTDRKGAVDWKSWRKRRTTWKPGWVENRLKFEPCVFRTFRKCLLPFSPESFILQFAIQKIKIKTYRNIILLYIFMKYTVMQQRHKKLHCLLASVFCSVHHQTVHHFELKKSHTILLIQNWKITHSIYIVIDKNIKIVWSGWNQQYIIKTEIY